MEMDRAGMEHDELAHNVDNGYQDSHNYKDENNRIKKNIEELRAVSRHQQEHHDDIK